MAAALSAGVSALRRWRLILLLTLGAALLGGFAAAPLGPAMHDAFADTLVGDHLLRNHPTFAPTDFLEFLHEKAPAVAGVRSAMLWAFVLGLLLQIFLTGGIVETVGREAEPSRDVFWAGARRHFAHNLKCFAIFALGGLVFVGGWLALSGALGKRVFETSPPHAAGRTAWSWTAAIVALCLFGALKLWADFARAERRSSPAVGAIAAFRAGRRRLGGRWLRGMALLLVWAVAGAAGIAVLLSISWGQATPTWGAVFVNFVLLALLLMVRPAGLVAGWGSILALFDASPLPSPPDETPRLHPANAWSPAPSGAAPLGAAPDAVLPPPLPSGAPDDVAPRPDPLPPPATRE